MTEEAFYGEELKHLKQAERQLLAAIAEYPYPAESGVPDSLHPIQYCISRIKSPESMEAKLKKRGLPVNAKTALNEVHDALGVRIICSFMDDVYKIADWLLKRPELSSDRKDLRRAGKGRYRGDPDAHDRAGFLGKPGTSVKVQA